MTITFEGEGRGAKVEFFLRDLGITEFSHLEQAVRNKLRRVRSLLGGLDLDRLSVDEQTGWFKAFIPPMPPETFLEFVQRANAIKAKLQSILEDFGNVVVVYVNGDPEAVRAVMREFGEQRQLSNVRHFPENTVRATVAFGSLEPGTKRFYQHLDGIRKDAAAIAARYARVLT